PTLATYIGVGVGFTHEEWAVESSTPGVLKEFDSTGNLEFNMNGGVFWRFADGFSLQVHHDSAFQATSFGLIFWNS
ncbi:MAG: hypothetical protein MK213_06610, partial [Planctomycetes bacterium]|nr:hypothetical protein [Planctomycetota bacterium]